jgi:2-polyprenyl-3-methyl-5-hydroxy-6-metoxy-1,4-benzoquinol methylase
MSDQVSQGLLSPFVRKQRLKAAEPYLKGKVLDVGCGSGALAGLIPTNRYLGVDIDEESLAQARQEYPQHCFQTMLPPPDPIFNTVVSLAVIEHVPNPATFLKDMAKVLFTSLP